MSGTKGGPMSIVPDSERAVGSTKAPGSVMSEVRAVSGPTVLDTRPAPGVTMKELVGLEWSQLCFNTDELLSAEFSVDALVLRHRQRAGLERLRADLGLCLRLLRAAMIDLINRDYADFVNLSSNLVGLEAGIGRLRLPLGQLREHVLDVRRAFDALLAETERRLRQLHAVRAQKRYLRRLAALPGGVSRLRSLLAEPPDTAGLERAAAEHAQLQYALRACSGAALARQLQPEADRLQTELGQRLQDALLNALQQQDADTLAHVLRIFATLDQVGEAERLFREHVVEPELERLISATALRDSPRGLRGLLHTVLEAVPVQARLLLAVMRREPAAAAAAGAGQPGFDFLVHAVWPAVVERIEEQIPAVFAPGNPDNFHRNYSACMEFVTGFEAACGSRASVTRLRRHEACERLLSRWNLAVYFQIRLQEVGGALESALATQGAVCAGPAVWTAVRRCWAPDVLLRPLTHRFWQLTLQLVSRCCTAAEARLTAAEPPPPPTCVSALSELAELEARLASVLETLVVPALPDLPSEAVGSMRSSLAPSEARLSALRPLLQQCYTGQLAAAATAPLRAVSDIPRLYRRTNRDLPSAASAYVAAAAAPLEQFAAEACAGVPAARTAALLAPAVARLCAEYADRVRQVLTSVQRMEESLRRLKRPRAAAGLTAPAASDDDKIRAQLRLDVAELGRKLRQLGLSTGQLQPHNQLRALVTGAPESAAPATGAPESAAPATGAPESQTFITGAPESAAPATGAPERGLPITGALERSATATGGPGASVPVIGASESSAAVTGAPESSVFTDALAPLTDTPALE